MSLDRAAAGSPAFDRRCEAAGRGSGLDLPPPWLAGPAGGDFFGTRSAIMQLSDSPKWPQTRAPEGAGICANEAGVFFGCLVRAFWGVRVHIVFKGGSHDYSWHGEGSRETRIQGQSGRARKSIGLCVGGGVGRAGARSAKAGGFSAPPSRALSAKLQLHG